MVLLVWTGPKRDLKDQRFPVRHSFVWNLTWKNGLEVPSEDAVQEGVEVHEADGDPQAEVVLLQRTRHQILPLNTDPLLLKQSKVLAPKAKGYRRQQALQDRDQSVT